MWFFDWFAKYFGYVTDYFNSMAGNIATVPVLGQWLSQPFYYISSFFANLSTAAQYASQWSDTVYTSAGSIFSAIQSYLTSTYAVLTATGSWFFAQVKSYIDSTYAILSMSSNQFFAWIKSSIDSTYAILSMSSNQFFAWIKSSIDSTYAILSMSSKQLFDYVSNVNLSAWIASWWSGQSNAVLNFVTAQWGYLITSVFSFLGSNWSSFENSFAWLCGKLLSLMIKNITSFAGSLWSLVEAVLKNIQVQVK